MGIKSRRVLIVENDDELARLLRLHLEGLGCEVDRCSDGAAGAVRALEGTAWSLLVLERNLPGRDGIELCRQIRSRASYLPVLMLSSQSAELDRALGLDCGADDYLTKPLSFIEFAARVRAILRRVEQLSRQSSIHLRTLRIGDLEIDFEKRIARRAGFELDLTLKEFELLAHLMRHPLKVFTRSELLDHVWGTARDAFEHAVDSHINRLRAKLEPCPRQPRYISTVRGVGYRFSSRVICS